MTSQKRVSFCEYVLVKGYDPEHNIAEGQIKTVALENDSNPQKCRKYNMEHNQEEGLVMRFSKCLIGKS